MSAAITSATLLQGPAGGEAHSACVCTSTSEQKWLWPSTNPGTSVRPARSVTSVAAPLCFITSASVPTATILPPAIATASAARLGGVHRDDRAAANDPLGGGGNRELGRDADRDEGGGKAAWHDGLPKANRATRATKCGPRMPESLAKATGRDSGMARD